MYDVIIVGARVAGSATALLLARRGLKVLAVDRATFPSDTLSTHQVQVPAVARLARWGVLGPILAAGTPPTRHMRFQQGSTAFTGRAPEVGDVDFMVSPRRTLLDAVLVDAARAAGAEVREDFSVEEVLIEDGRVTGVRGRVKGGVPIAERAGYVVGADGRRSRVARAVGAAAYRAVPARSMAFYTYWEDLPVRGGELYGVPRRAVGLWPTNGGLTLSYVAWPVAEFPAFRRDVEGNGRATLGAVGLADRVRGARRVERWRGTPDLPGHFRRPYGPGWALVGDAGLALDPITGLGIADALRDAETLAAALAAILGDAARPGPALRGYQRARDRAAQPMYDFSARLAELRPPTPGETRLFAALADNPEAAQRFFAVIAGARPLRELMSPAYLIRLLGLRGFLQLAAGARTAHGHPEHVPVPS